MLETLKTIGSFGGLLSIGLLLWDRLLRARPNCHLHPTDGRLFLRVKNVVDETIVIDGIDIEPKSLTYASGHDIDATADVIGRMLFKQLSTPYLTLNPFEERLLPLIAMNKFADDLSPKATVRIIVYWRTTRGSWWPWRTWRTIKTSAGDISRLRTLAKERS